MLAVVAVIQAGLASGGGWARLNLAVGRATIGVVAEVLLQ